MRKNLIVFSFAMLVTVGLLCFAIDAVPSYLVEKRNQEYLAEAGGFNRFFHQQLPNANFTAFVSPSPDLLYSYLVFDVSESALLVEFPRHDDYWINQMVATNTDSFAYIGYKDQTQGELRFVLTLPEQAPAHLPPNTKVIETPTKTGTFLLRYLVRNKAALADIDAKRRQIQITELEY